MYVYIVRHAQSRGEVNDREHYSFDPLVKDFEEKDPSLTPHGVKQAALLAHRLSPIEFDAVLCAPLHSHIATANEILKLQKNKKIEIINDLLETHIHDYAGIPQDILAKLYPDIEIIPCPDPTPTGGNYLLTRQESFDPQERLIRARRVEKYITNRFPNDANVLVLTSTIFGGKSLLPSIMRTLPPNPDAISFCCEAASVSKIELRADKLSSACVYVNDKTHLKTE